MVQANHEITAMTRMSPSWTIVDHFSQANGTAYLKARAQSGAWFSVNFTRTGAVRNLFMCLWDDGIESGRCSGEDWVPEPRLGKREALMRFIEVHG